MRKVTKPADNRFQEADEIVWEGIGCFRCDRCSTELDMLRSPSGRIALDMICSECGHGHFFHEVTFVHEEEPLEAAYRVGPRGIYGGGD